MNGVNEAGGTCPDANARSKSGVRSASGEGPGHQPWLSILVPVYNVRPYVEECLNSILNQMDGHDIELILLDDCGTDGSADFCASFLANCSGNVRMLRHDRNRGLSAARNTMLEAASGKYVWFIDSDDALLPGAIDALYQIALLHAPDTILCDYVREEGKRFIAFDGPRHVISDDLESLIAGTFSNRRMHIWSRIWKRDLFGDSIRFPEGACFEDIATTPRLMLRSKTFFYAAEPWLYYRSRPGSIISQLTCARAFDPCRNDDLACALSGFHEELRVAIPDVSDATMFKIARFSGREFVKITKRLIRARLGWRKTRSEIERYRAVMEACSPISFATLVRDYLWIGKVDRALLLWLALAMCKPAQSGNRFFWIRAR